MPRSALCLLLFACAGEPYPLVVAARAPGWAVTCDVRADTNGDFKLTLMGEDADKQVAWLRSPKVTRQIGAYQARDPSGRYLVHRGDDGLVLVDTQGDTKKALNGASRPRFGAKVLTFFRGDKAFLLKLADNSETELHGNGAVMDAFPVGESALLKVVPRDSNGDGKLHAARATFSDACAGGVSYADTPGDDVIYQFSGAAPLQLVPLNAHDYLPARNVKALSIVDEKNKVIATTPCADRVLYSRGDTHVVSCGTDVLRFSAKSAAKVIARNAVAPFFESPTAATRLLWLPTWDGELVYDLDTERVTKLDPNEEFVALFDDAILVRRDTTLVVRQGERSTVVAKDVPKARGHYARRLDCWSQRCTWQGNQATAQPDGAPPMQSGAFVFVDGYLISLRSITARRVPGLIMHITSNGEVLRARDALEGGFVGAPTWYAP